MTGAATPLPRSQFAAVTDRWRYFNHASTAPLPQVCVDAIQAWSDHLAANGRVGHDQFDVLCERARTAAAALMGVDADHVAFVKNTTEGLGFAANGLRWRPGDRVIVARYEYPSTLYPWLALADVGVEVDLVEPEGESRALPLERFEAALQRGPAKVVVVSWVQFGRGWRTDLAALGVLCREAGALLCADVVQGLGVLPCALGQWGVDVAMAGGHKWLLAPRGSGVIYVAPGLVDQIRPLEPGEASIADRYAWEDPVLDWATGARRYEGGTLNTVGTVGLGASLDLLLEAGIDRVWAHVDALCDQLCAGLAAIEGVTVRSDRSLGGRSAIVNFTVAGHAPDDFRLALERRGVAVASVAGGLRTSPHGYNTYEDVDALVEAVATTARAAGGVGGGP
jgi:selenocysteine lyase/cysteine desulfurase